jgi:hypothetical protein
MRVYYSTETQDEYGTIIRSWTFDRTERCFIKTVTNYAIGEFNSWNQKLVGVSEEDLLIDDDGQLHAPSEVLITFDEPPYIEPAGPRKGLPTAFELHGSTPVLGAFGEALHFDISLSRSQNQAVQL